MNQPTPYWTGLLNADPGALWQLPLNELTFARKLHAQIQHAATILHDRAEANRTRAWYHAWLAERHFHEVWERVDGHFQLTRLVSTAGQSWGGA